MSKLTKAQNANLPPRPKPYPYDQTVPMVRRGPILSKPTGHVFNEVTPGIVGVTSPKQKK